jgi:monoamine oxidase
MSYKGPAIVGRDTSVDSKRMYSLTCFVNGEHGRRWGALPSHERRAQVLKQLAEIYDEGPDSEVFRPIEVFEQIWMHEPFSQGALTPVTALGHLVKHKNVYGKPVGNIHFVGTEFSPSWKGYMEGAIVSGEVGAKEVVHALSRTVRARL